MNDQLDESRMHAIKKAELSVIVFSSDYASSPWCLDELVKIIECKEKMGQIVIPVFYGVDASEVLKQKKEFVGEKHKVDKWRRALDKAVSLPGWDSRSIRLVFIVYLNKTICIIVVLYVTYYKCL